MKVCWNSSHFCQRGNLSRQKSATELQRDKLINLRNRVVRHKVWEVFTYEMRISKQSKIENIYEAVSEIGDAGS